MIKRMTAAFRFTFRLFLMAFHGWSRADAAVHAAAIAYAALFSLAPLIILVFGLTSSFTTADWVLKEIERQMPGPVGLALAELVKEVLRNREPVPANPWLVVLTLLMLAYGASRLFLQLRRSLNRMYSLARKPQHLTRSTLDFVMDRIFGAFLVMSVGIGFVLVIMATLGLGIFSGSNSTVSGLGNPTSASSLLVSYLINVAIFAMLFKFVPQATVRWRDVLPGALVTALLYLLGNIAVGIYFVFAKSILQYGAASFVLVLLFWVYVMSMITLFGAKFTEVYASLRGGRIRPDTIMEFVPDSVLYVES